MTMTDSSGKVVKVSKSNTLTLSRDESAKLSNGDFTVTYALVPGNSQTAYLTNYAITANQKLSPLPTKSGNKDIDAILAGSYYWWHDLGQVATISDTLITDTVKQIDGARTTIYYDYLETGAETYLSNSDRSGFEAMDTDQRTAVVSALDYLSSLINVTFEQDANRADIVFGTNQQTDSSGYAKYPLGNGGNPSVVMLDNRDSEGTETNTGAELQDKTSYAWYTLIHELGHAMGLKHPGPYNAGGGKAPPPYLSGSKDNRITTVMSYKDAPGTINVSVSGTSTQYSYSYQGTSPTSYKALDIAALQYIYGANRSTTAEAIDVADGFKAYQAVWAPLGVALDASDTSRTNVFDLRPGGYSSISVLSSADQLAALSADVKAKVAGVSDVSATSIATNILKNKALKGKVYNGTNTMGLAWGSKYTEVTGGSGADRFYAGAYSATVDGGTGSDTLYLQGKVTEWTSATLQDGSKTYINQKTGAVITAKGIEAVAYYKSTAKAV